MTSRRSLQRGRESGGATEETRRMPGGDAVERILRTAAALFAFRGYAGTSVEEIVETAKTTKPTLYHHFKDKRTLYVTLLDETMSAFCSALEPPSVEPSSARIRLRRLFLRVDGFRRGQPNEMHLVNAHLYGPPSGTPRYRLSDYRGRIEESISNVLLPAVAEGKVREEDFGSLLLIVLSLLQDMQHAAGNSIFTCGPSMEQYFKALDLLLEG